MPKCECGSPPCAMCLVEELQDKLLVLSALVRPTLNENGVTVTYDDFWAEALAEPLTIRYDTGVGYEVAP